MKNPKDMSSFVYGIRNEVIHLGLGIIKETLEDCIQMLWNGVKREQSWSIVKTDTKKLIMSLGSVSFEKTLFKHKHSVEYVYLLDRILGIARHEHKQSMPVPNCWPRRLSPPIEEVGRDESDG